MLDEFGNRKTLIFMLNLICNIEANSLGDMTVMVVGVFLGCAWPQLLMLYGLHMAAWAPLHRNMGNNEHGKSCQKGHYPQTVSASVRIAFKYKGCNFFAQSLQCIHFSVVTGIFPR